MAHPQLSFLSRLCLALAAAAVAAALLAPFAAALVAAAGMRFPFPRIFDRVIMATLAASLLWAVRALGFGRLIRAGFARPRANYGRALRGFASGLGAFAVLWMLAMAVGGQRAFSIWELLRRLPEYLSAALLVAIIEEGFFRAFLLGGLLDDFAPRTALVLSAAIYALAHVIRSPAAFYSSGLDLGAGFRTLASSVGQLADPISVLPALVGLFLLGLLLGEAFLATGTVYLSAGLHAGLVLVAKSWRIAAPPADSLPRWLEGYARPAVISGVAAWVVTLALLMVIRRLARRGPAPLSPE